MGIAAARALLNSSPDVADLSLRFRKEVRLYYKVGGGGSGWRLGRDVYQ